MNQTLVNALRGIAGVGLLALTTAGCFLFVTFDPEVPRLSNHDCEAEVTDHFGLRRTVYSYDETSSDGVVPSQCFIFWDEHGIDSLEDLEDAWHRWLDAAIEDDGWCIVADTISCEEAGQLEETCASVTLPTEARGFCVEEIPCCIRRDPAEIDFEALQEAEGMNRWTPVGTTSEIEPAATLRNDCDYEISFTPRDGLSGEHPGDFELVNDNCVVPEPPEEHPDGLALGAAGSADDSCAYQVRFTPAARGPRSAQLDFVQTGSTACAPSDMPRFVARGRAGELSGLPEEICLGSLTTLSCAAAFNGELTNDGPGIVTIESIEVTGDFELVSAASAVLDPGEPMTLRIRWCMGIAGDVDEDGTLTIVSNAFDSEILVPLSRRVGGCP
jgi:hypothetical protein